MAGEGFGCDSAGSGQKQIGAELVEEGSSGIREQRGPARKRKQRVMVVGVAAGKEAMAVGTAGGRDNWAAVEGAAGSEGRRCSLRYFGSKGRRQWRKARLGARSRGCNKRCTSPPILLAAEEIRLPSILAVGSTGEEAEDTSSLHREKRTKERSPWQEERTRKIVAGGSEGQRENRCSHRFAVLLTKRTEQQRSQKGRRRRVDVEAIVCCRWGREGAAAHWS
ncbi:hypothetical protein GW17_00036416 [Ensete ventricosum]|nr:hypothetical protein GW17_00036416 [Ensete ventricosum]